MAHRTTGGALHLASHRPPRPKLFTSGGLKYAGSSAQCNCREIRGLTKRSVRSQGVRSLGSSVVDPTTGQSLKEAPVEPAIIRLGRETMNLPPFLLDRWLEQK